MILYIALSSVKFYKDYWKGLKVRENATISRVS
jgi:hypothetical protein